MKRVLLAVGFLLVSLLLARLWLNSALLWNVLSYVPKKVWEMLAVATEPITSSSAHSNEELLEFLASWFVALIALAIIGGVVLLIRRLAHQVRRTRRP